MSLHLILLKKCFSTQEAISIVRTISAQLRGSNGFCSNNGIGCRHRLWFWISCLCRVTRLGYFWKILAVNSLTKESQNKALFVLLWNTAIAMFWTTFPSNIWFFSFVAMVLFCRTEFSFERKRKNELEKVERKWREKCSATSLHSVLGYIVSHESIIMELHGIILNATLDDIAYYTLHGYWGT